MTLVDVYLNRLNCFPFLILKGSLLVILKVCMIFFHHSSMLQERFQQFPSSHSNSLPIERFPLTYDLNCFKSKINRHFLTVDSF